MAMRRTRGIPVSIGYMIGIVGSSSCFAGYLIYSALFNGIDEIHIISNFNWLSNLLSALFGALYCGKAGGRAFQVLLGAKIDDRKARVFPSLVISHPRCQF